MQICMMDMRLGLDGCAEVMRCLKIKDREEERGENEIQSHKYRNSRVILSGSPKPTSMLSVVVPAPSHLNKKRSATCICLVFNISGKVHQERKHVCRCRCVKHEKMGKRRESKKKKSEGMYALG